jgi:hypothetical protein
VNRYVLVDATTGAIALDFTQVEAALNRQVCDQSNVRLTTPLACTSTPTRTESQAATGNVDVDGAYDLAGVTYNFYRNVLGRDSVDGAGRSLLSTVRVCLDPTNPGFSSCPYANAFWDGSTNQMYYGQGFASADDVVGHELTHGVTQFTSKLAYYGQAGAINESISDVFGELIDRSTPDLGTPWALGEDLPGHPSGIRNMQNPPLFGDPDRVGSPLYTLASSDNAGVHTNSGVNNKAAYLIDAGGTFNGQTIVGLGDAKTAWIYYVAQTTMLSSLSQYSDLAVILPQACTNLVGQHGIVANDCVQVSKAVLATEMKSRPTAASGLAEPAECITPGLVKNHLVVSDRQNLTTEWLLSPSAPASQAPTVQRGVTTADLSIVFPDPSVAVTMTATRKDPMTIPAGETYLSFRHLVSLQPNHDGGVVDYSNDNGVTWHDVAALAGQGVGNNGYDGVASAVGSSAFTTDVPVFRTTRFNLSALAGSSVRLRFREVTDVGGSSGWFISGPTVYTCGAPNAPDAPIKVTAVAGVQSATVSWPLGTFNGGSPITQYTVTPRLNGVPQPPLVVGLVTSAVVAGLPVGSAYTFTVAATNVIGRSAESSPSNSVTPLAAPPPPAPPPFASLVPARLMETRSGLTTVDDQYNGIGLRPAGSVTALTVAGRGGVPVDASSVNLNVTVTEAQGDGFLTVYPCGVARPVASNLNFVAGSTIANMVTVKVGASGQVCIYAHATTHVLVDVGGYFPSGAALTPLVPARLVESRIGLSTVDGLQNGIGVRSAGSVTEVQVTGRAGIPSDATAVMLNVTVTETQAEGFVTVFPCGSSLPTASNLNYLAGMTIPNAVVAKLGVGGTVCVYTQSATQLIVDASGWFPAISDLVPLDPARLMESRSGLITVDGQYNGIGLRGAGVITELQVTNRGGVPANATAVALNVTVTDAQAAGFVTVFPCGMARPTASNLNYGIGTIIPNAVIAKVGAGGMVCFYTHTPTQILADVNGYFTG